MYVLLSLRVPKYLNWIFANPNFEQRFSRQTTSPDCVNLMSCDWGATPRSKEGSHEDESCVVHTCTGELIPKNHHITAQSLKNNHFFSEIANIHRYCVCCLQYPLMF
jgi:hypothetical protein